MEFTLDELKDVLKAREQLAPCTKTETCSDCKIVNQLIKDPQIDAMLGSQFRGILNNPVDMFGFVVAYIQIGASLKEAQMMKEMFCEKPNPNKSFSAGA